MSGNRWDQPGVPHKGWHCVDVVDLRADGESADEIEKYAPILCGATPPVVRDPRLLMDASGNVKIYYAPFEYINHSARIVLVGITPGPTQMVNANNEAQRAL